MCKLPFDAISSVQLTFFSSEAQENPSSNDAQPEKARPEHNTSQPPEDSRPYANANGKGGRSKPRGTPQGRGDRNNRRTHARTSSEPHNRRRESPQKVGEKTCTVHMKAKGPKRQEKAGKDRKRREKARKGTHCTPRAKRPKRGALYKTVPQTAAPLTRQQNRKVWHEAEK